MDLVIDRAAPPGADEGGVEVVERKGAGHPDTICDALAEETSRALSRLYLERFGAVLHHNVDKVLLVGGASRPAFGGGEVLEPIEVILAGRATREARGTGVPVDELAVETCRAWLREHLHALDVDRHVRLQTRVRPGSADLVDLFLRQADTGHWLANDTSIGVGYAPLSPLERAVLAAERALWAPEARQAHPELGEDVKVMGIRRGDRVELTVADAFVDRWVADLDAYRRGLDTVRQLVTAAARVELGSEPEVWVNAADDVESGSVYLTVTGTSAESGDDGEAGRGNRANGLITPYRPMTMESLAGKNPVSHVGKIYNVAAQELCEALVAELPGIAAAQCVLLSRIGQPVNDPQGVHLRLRPVEGVALEELRSPAEELARARIAAMGDAWRRLLEGPSPLYG